MRTKRRIRKKRKTRKRSSRVSIRGGGGDKSCRECGVGISYQIQGTQLIIHGFSRDHSELKRTGMYVLCRLITNLRNDSDYWDLKTINLVADDDGSQRLIKYFEDYGFHRKPDIYEVERYARAKDRAKDRAKKRARYTYINMSNIDTMIQDLGFTNLDDYKASSRNIEYLGIEMECDIDEFIRKCQSHTE
jgi:hypothetical protein